VLLVARAVAGFASPRRDSLRRAMTKGRSRAEMARSAVTSSNGGRARRRARRCRRGLPPARRVRRLRLQQGARRLLRGGLLRERLAQGRTTRPSSPRRSSTTSRWASTRRVSSQRCPAARHRLLPPHVNESQEALHGCRCGPGHPRRPARRARDDRAAALRHRARASGASLPRPRRLSAPYPCRGRLPRASSASARSTVSG
jgi:hypothetical protein